MSIRAYFHPALSYVRKHQISRQSTGLYNRNKNAHSERNIPQSHLVRASIDFRPSRCSLAWFFMHSAAVLLQTIALFIYPAKSNFFVRLQIFLYAGCNFFPPEELPPHAENNQCSYLYLQICSRNLHNWHFLEISL